MKKLYLYVLLVVILLGTGSYFYFTKSESAELKYRTEKISRGEIMVQVRATGTINPVQKVQVGSQVSGIISRINVDFNSVVKKGDVLAQIDSTFLSASVKEAEANVERNMAQVNEAKRALARTNDLFAKGFASQSELDAAQTSYESAAAQLKQTQAALDRAKVNLRYSIIRSPIDGVVISRDIEVGQTVAASLQAPQLFAIGNDLTRMQVEASVDEADIGQIKEAQSVTFSVDSYPDEIFKGTVKQVRLAPITTQNVVTYTVIIDVPNPDLKLRPGMTATVSILIEKHDDVLRISSLALRFTPPTEVLEKSGMGEKGGKAQRAEGAGTKGAGTKGAGTKGASTKGAGMQGGAGEGRGNREGGKNSGGKKKSGTVWLLDSKGNIKQATVMLGLNDTRFVEILEGDVKEGDMVITGTSAIETAMGGGQQSNPFAPRMQGGGGRGMR